MDADKLKKYKQEILEVINKHKIVKFDHCHAFTSFKRTTAYSYKLNESDDIKEAIEKNTAKAKNYLINKWLDSDNATLQIAAFRLLADSEEHRKLNQSYTDHTTDGVKMPIPRIIMPKLDDE